MVEGKESHRWRDERETTEKLDVFLVFSNFELCYALCICTYTMLSSTLLRRRVTSFVCRKNLLVNLFLLNKVYFSFFF